MTLFSVKVAGQAKQVLIYIYAHIHTCNILYIWLMTRVCPRKLETVGQQEHHSVKEKGLHIIHGYW